MIVSIRLLLVKAKNFSKFKVRREMRKCFQISGLVHCGWEYPTCELLHWNTSLCMPACIYLNEDTHIATNDKHDWKHLVVFFFYVLKLITLWNLLVSLWKKMFYKSLFNRCKYPNHRGFEKISNTGSHIIPELNCVLNSYSEWLASALIQTRKCSFLM